MSEKVEESPAMVSISNAPTIVEESAIEPKDASEAEAASSPPPHVVPDGSLRAWCTVAGSWLIITCSFGSINAFGVYQSYYIETLLPSYSASAISWIGSLQLFFLFGMGVIAGKLFDAHYYRPMLIVGMLLTVGCTFALSAVPKDAYYAVFLSQGVGIGLGQGIMYLPSMAVMAHHFHTKRAIAMGICISGSSFGGVIFPIMLNNLFVSVGFAWGVRAAGFLVLGCLIIGNLLVSSNYNPEHKAMKKPSVMQLLRDPPYAMSCVAVFLNMWAIFMVFFFIQVYAETHGISQNLSFYSITIMNAASIFGRTLPNLVAHRVGPITLLIPWMFINAILVFALFGINSAAALIVYCILYGFFSGAVFSLFSPMLATMSDSMAEIGTRMGLAFLTIAVGALTGVPINGALLGSGPDYAWWKAILFSGITMTASVCFMIWTYLLQRKKKGKLWV